MEAYETIWMPDQDQLYVIVSSRDPSRREIIAFPHARVNGEKEQLCFISTRGHVMHGSIGEMSKSRIKFIWEHDGQWEQLTVREMTDVDFEAICLQRRMNRWAVPQTKEELYTWYTDMPSQPSA